MLLICSLERAEGIFSYSTGNCRKLSDMNEKNFKRIEINEGILNGGIAADVVGKEKNCGVYLKV